MKIEFNNELNDVFQDGNDVSETARLLRKIADNIEDGMMVGAVLDLNGNKVGSWSF